MALTLPPGVQWGSLTNWQINAFLAGDPNFMLATAPGPGAAGAAPVSAAPLAPQPLPAPGSVQLLTPQIPAAIAQTANNPAFATVPFIGGSTTVEMTLDSHMAQWAASAIAYPQLRPADPLADAASYAQGICTGGYSPPPDCANQAAIAQQYGQAVADAWASIAPALAPAPAPTPSPTAPPVAPSPTAAPKPALAAAAPPSTGAAAAAGLGPETNVYGALKARLVSVPSPGAVSSTVINAVAGFITAINPILGAIFGWFFGGNAVSELAKAVQKLAQAVAKNEDQITQLAWSTAWGLGNLWIADAFIFDNFLDQIWTNLKNVWTALWKHLTELIPLIIDQIRKLNDRFKDFYKKYILPHMKWIQLARLFLYYLRLFHIKIFDRLDRIISQIQLALFNPFLWLMRIVNLHGLWFNVVLAADMTIQKAIWIRTMSKFQGEMVNMFWTAQTNPVGSTAGGASPVPPPAVPLTQGFIYSGSGGQTQAPPGSLGSAKACLDFFQWASTGTGPVAEQADTALATFLATLLP